MFVHTFFQSKQIWNQSAGSCMPSDHDRPDHYFLARAARLVSGSMLYRMQQAVDEFQGTIRPTTIRVNSIDEDRFPNPQNHYLRQLFNHRVKDDFQSEWRARIARILRCPVKIREDEKWGNYPLFVFRKFEGLPVSIPRSHESSASEHIFNCLLILSAPEDGLSISHLLRARANGVNFDGLVGTEVERMFANEGDLVIWSVGSDVELASYGESAAALEFKLRVAEGHAETWGGS
jgi:hypothetical protein